MLRWYLIHSKPAAEAIARANLERQGYEVYFPRLIQPVRRRGRWHDAVVALFPGYLFLHLDEGEQVLSPVRSTIGVSDIVRFGARFAIVPDRVVRALRLRAHPESGLHHLMTRSEMRVGALVRIACGPLAGLEGVFQCNAGADRVVLLLNILGRDTAVKIPAGYVVPRFAV
jgi:transcriptional antiterminator RfaH